MKARHNQSDNAVLLSYTQAQQRYNLGINTIRKIANDCGAVRHLGKSARIIASVLDDYIMSLSE